MQRARRKKSKSKKKKVKKKCIDERETLSYEQEILDNNRQLARLRSRNEELEEQAELAKEKFRQLEEDRSDVIAHLKRSLEEKIEESKELSERLTALEELRKDELAAYKKKEEAMDNEYRTMENNLSAEVKLAAGKLNALEDWRLARLDLLQKFEKQEQEMAEQEKRHKEELYEAEKSVVVGKSVMQKEMKEHLQILSERLLKAVTLRITEVMNRAIHENVALNRDLDKLLKTNRELDAINIESKKTEQTLRLKCELFETETQIILNKTLKQRHAIHQVVEEYESLIMYYGQVQRSNVRLKQLQSILENIIKRKDALLDKEMKQYEKNILMARNENKRLVKLIQNKEKELDTLKTILNTATTFLNEALQVTEKAYNNQQCLGKTAPKLLQSLMEILQTETIISAVDYSPSEIDNIDCKYTLGCLGLIEPIKEGKVAKQEKNDIQEEVQEGESLKDLECIPSCLLSDISSSVCSPKE
ncbi:cilia- and flagella-associated protein 157 [Bombus vosnesenskii]|uniref:Cilia- and flagella-associated protein 157 n=1 Tax=Bombus vosnesenskii TaxID=207650 RepID=A0A6J3LF75_9HYME|nr:cilia- and flagella-associated protein 157 [Bombus vosnesenskii]